MSFLQKIYTKLEQCNYNTFHSSFDPIDFFSSEYGVLFQRAVLCGEYYNLLEFGKVESEGNALGAELTVLMRNNASTWNGLDLAAILNAKSEAEKTYLGPFSTLVTGVGDSLDSYLAGKENKNTDFALVRDFYLKTILTENFEEGQIEEALLEVIVYRLNIQLAMLDEYLECSRELVNQLKMIENFLENQTIPEKLEEIVHLLFQKIAFLIFKIKFRTLHPTLKPIEHADDVDEVPDTNAYKYFADKCKIHTQTFTIKQTRQFNEDTDTGLLNPARLKIEPLHHIRKVLCENRHSEDKSLTLKRLKERSDNVYEKFKAALATDKGPITFYDNSNSFDKMAYTTVQQLFSNASLMLELKIEQKNNYATIKAEVLKSVKSNDRNTIKFLNDIYDRLNKRAFQKGAPRDYFCYYILFDFLNNMLANFKENAQAFFQDISSKDNISIDQKKSRIREMISELEYFYDRVLFKLSENFAIIQSYRVLPVYLTIEESKIEYEWRDNETDRLFLKSSYILPIDYAKLQNQVAYWQSHAKSQMNTLRDSFQIAVDHQNIRENFAEFDKKIRENEFKTVQIVAMFVSIAAFVLVNVTIFKDRTAIESFAILTGLAGCLILFNVFFYAIIMAQHKTFNSLGIVALRIGMFMVLPASLCFISYKMLCAEDGKKTSHIAEMDKELKKDSVTIVKLNEALYKLDLRHVQDSMGYHHLEQRLKKIEDRQ